MTESWNDTLGNEPYRSEDLGEVVEVDNPPGVSWLRFYNVSLSECYEDRNTLAVPVTTQELEESGVALQSIRDGYVRYVWAQVTMGAANLGDVKPSELQALPLPDAGYGFHAFDSGSQPTPE